jgi:hypothetical protein
MGLIVLQGMDVLTNNKKEKLGYRQAKMHPAYTILKGFEGLNDALYSAWGLEDGIHGKTHCDFEAKSF